MPSSDEKPQKRSLELDASMYERGFQPVQKAWFLGIGIDDYQQEDFADLSNAVKDVEAVADLLLTRYDHEPEQVTIIKNEEATEAGIMKEFERLAKEVSQDDKLIIYYSGHGHVKKVGQREWGFWIPYDAQKGNSGSYIPNSTIRDYLDAIPSRHLLLISDSCFSGSLLQKGNMRSTANPVMEELESKPSRWAICSGQHDEEVYDGEPGKHSPFAESILVELTHNFSTALNVGRLADKVMDQTRGKYRQLPLYAPIALDSHKNGQYVFRLKKDEGLDWEQSQTLHTLAAYQAFLKRHPEGKFHQEAQEKIDFLTEEAAWQKASEEHTYASYMRYEEAYHHGRYAREALARIAVFEEEKAWKKALRKDTYSAYREYLLDYPRGAKVQEAREKLDAIKLAKAEPNAWEEAQKTGTIASFQAYLKQYPNGRFKFEAEDRIQSLSQQQASIAEAPVRDSAPVRPPVKEEKQTPKKEATIKVQPKRTAESSPTDQEKRATPLPQPVANVANASSAPAYKKHLKWAIPVAIVLLIAMVAGLRGGDDPEPTISTPTQSATVRLITSAEVESYITQRGYTIKNARIEVQNNHVTLFGEANSEADKANVLNVVSNMGGVRGVSDQMTVYTPPAPTPKKVVNPYTRAEWRNKFYRTERNLSWFVTVASLGQVSESSAKRSIQRLEQKFPNVEFRLLATVATDKYSNQQYAIRAGEGLSSSEANELVRLVRSLGIASDAYKMQVPEGWY